MHFSSRRPNTNMLKELQILNGYVGMASCYLCNMLFTEWDQWGKLILAIAFNDTFNLGSQRNTPQTARLLMHTTLMKSKFYRQKIF